MRHSKMFLRGLSTLLLQIFIVQQLAWASPEPLVSKHSFDQKPQVSLKFPASVASIEDAYKNGGDKLFYLLQDAHTNESGQFNLASALSIILEEEKDLKLIFTEAGVEDGSLSFLRSQKPLSERTKLARQYIRKGLLHGEEYLDLTSDKDFTLWGVEDLELYKRAIEDYRTVAKERERLSLYLKKIDSTLGTLKDRLMGPSLQDFSKERKLYHKDKLALTSYFTVLLREAHLHSIDLQAYPHLKNLKDLKDREDSLDFAKANQEHIQALQGLPEDVQDQLRDLTQAQKNRADKVLGASSKEEMAYFALLEEKLGARSSELGAGKYPELSKYFSYLKLARALEAKKVLDEIKALENHILGVLALSEDEKDLLKCESLLWAFEKLFTFALTPEEFKEYQSLSGGFSIEHLTGFLNKKIMDLGTYYERALFLEEGYDEAVKRAEDFYTLTLDRDEAFIQKALQKMQKENQKKAVLITGGFHTTNLKEMLKAKGISFISVTPQVLHETNIQRYEKILLGQTIKPMNTPLRPSVSTARTLGALIAAAMDQQAMKTIDAFRDDRDDDERESQQKAAARLAAKPDPIDKAIADATRAVERARAKSKDSESAWAAVPVAVMFAGVAGFLLYYGFSGHMESDVAGLMSRLREGIEQVRQAPFGPHGARLAEQNGDDPRAVLARRLFDVYHKLPGHLPGNLPEGQMKEIVGAFRNKTVEFSISLGKEDSDLEELSREIFRELFEMAAEVDKKLETNLLDWLKVLFLPERSQMPLFFRGQRFGYMKTLGKEDIKDVNEIWPMADSLKLDKRADEQQSEIIGSFLISALLGSATIEGSFGKAMKDADLLGAVYMEMEAHVVGSAGGHRYVGRRVNVSGEILSIQRQPNDAENKNKAEIELKTEVTLDGGATVLMTGKAKLLITLPENEWSVLPPVTRTESSSKPGLSHPLFKSRLAPQLVDIALIRRMIELSGDDNDLHRFAAAVKAASAAFEEKILAHGVLIASLISALLRQEGWFDSSFFEGLSLRFLKPVYVGERVQAFAEVQDAYRTRHHGETSDYVKIKVTVQVEKGSKWIDAIVGTVILRLPKDASRSEAIQHALSELQEMRATYADVPPANQILPHLVRTLTYYSQGGDSMAEVYERIEGGTSVRGRDHRRLIAAAGRLRTGFFQPFTRTKRGLTPKLAELLDEFTFQEIDDMPFTEQQRDFLQLFRSGRNLGQIAKAGGYRNSEASRILQAVITRLERQKLLYEFTSEELGTLPFKEREKTFLQLFGAGRNLNQIAQAGGYDRAQAFRIMEAILTRLERHKAGSPDVQESAAERLSRETKAILEDLGAVQEDLVMDRYLADANALDTLIEELTGVAENTIADKFFEAADTIRRMSTGLEDFVGPDVVIEPITKNLNDIAERMRALSDESAAISGGPADEDEVHRGARLAAAAHALSLLVQAMTAGPESRQTIIDTVKAYRRVLELSGVSWEDATRAHLRQAQNSAYKDIYSKSNTREEVARRLLERLQQETTGFLGVVREGADWKSILNRGANVYDMLAEIGRFIDLAQTVVVFPPADGRLEIRGRDLHDQYKYIRELYEKINEVGRRVLNDQEFDVWKPTKPVHFFVASAAHQISLWEVYKREILKDRTPGGVLGISHGAVAAFYAAGAFDDPEHPGRSVETAIELMIKMALFLSEASDLAGRRRMGLALDIPRAELDEILKDHQGLVTIGITDNRFFISAPEDQFAAIKSKMQAPTDKPRATTPRLMHSPLAVSSHDRYLLSLDGTHQTPQTPVAVAHEAYLRDDFMKHVSAPSTTMALYSAQQGSGEQVTSPQDVYREFWDFIGKPIPSNVLPSLAKTDYRQYFFFGGENYFTKFQTKAGLLPEDVHASVIMTNDEVRSLHFEIPTLPTSLNVAQATALADTTERLFDYFVRVFRSNPSEREEDRLVADLLHWAMNHSAMFTKTDIEILIEILEELETKALLRTRIAHAIEKIISEHPEHIELIFSHLVANKPETQAVESLLGILYDAQSFYKDIRTFDKPVVTFTAEQLAILLALPTYYPGLSKNAHTEIETIAGIFSVERLVVEKLNDPRRVIPQQIRLRQGVRPLGLEFNLRSQSPKAEGSNYTLEYDGRVYVEAHAAGLLPAGFQDEKGPPVIQLSLTIDQFGHVHNRSIETSVPAEGDDAKLIVSLSASFKTWLESLSFWTDGTLAPTRVDAAEIAFGAAKTEGEWDEAAQTLLEEEALKGVHWLQVAVREMIDERGDVLPHLGEVTQRVLDGFRARAAAGMAVPDEARVEKAIWRAVINNSARIVRFRRLRGIPGILRDFRSDRGALEYATVAIEKHIQMLRGLLLQELEVAFEEGSISEPMMDKLVKRVIDCTNEAIRLLHPDILSDNSENNTKLLHKVETILRLAIRLTYEAPDREASKGDGARLSFDSTASETPSRSGLPQSRASGVLSLSRDDARRGARLAESIKILSQIREELDGIAESTEAPGLIAMFKSAVEQAIREINNQTPGISWAVNVIAYNFEQRGFENFSKSAQSAANLLPHDNGPLDRPLYTRHEFLEKFKEAVNETKFREANSIATEAVFQSSLTPHLLTSDDIKYIIGELRDKGGYWFVRPFIYAVMLERAQKNPPTISQVDFEDVWESTQNPVGEGDPDAALEAALSFASYLPYYIPQGFQSHHLKTWIDQALAINNPIDAAELTLIGFQGGFEGFDINGFKAAVDQIFERDFGRYAEMKRYPRAAANVLTSAMSDRRIEGITRAMVDSWKVQFSRHGENDLADMIERGYEGYTQRKSLDEALLDLKAFLARTRGNPIEVILHVVPKAWAESLEFKGNEPENEAAILERVAGVIKQAKDASVDSVWSGFNRYMIETEAAAITIRAVSKSGHTLPTGARLAGEAVSRLSALLDGTPTAGKSLVLQVISGFDLQVQMRALRHLIHEASEAWETPVYKSVLEEALAELEATGTNRYLRTSVWMLMRGPVVALAFLAVSFFALSHLPLNSMTALMLTLYTVIIFSAGVGVTYSDFHVWRIENILEVLLAQQMRSGTRPVMRPVRSEAASSRAAVFLNSGADQNVVEFHSIDPQRPPKRFDKAHLEGLTELIGKWSHYPFTVEYGKRTGATITDLSNVYWEGSDTMVTGPFFPVDKPSVPSEGASGAQLADSLGRLGNNIEVRAKVLRVYRDVGPGETVTGNVFGKKVSLKKAEVIPYFADEITKNREFALALLDDIVHQLNQRIAEKWFEDLPDASRLKKAKFINSLVPMLNAVTEYRLRRKEVHDVIRQSVQNAVDKLAEGKVSYTEIIKIAILGLLDRDAEAWINDHPVTETFKLDDQLHGLVQLLGESRRAWIEMFTYDFDDISVYPERPAIKLAGKDNQPTIWLLGWRYYSLEQRKSRKALGLDKKAFDITDIHDHGDANTAVYVFRGPIEERVYLGGVGESVRVVERTHEPGLTVRFNEDAVHAMGNIKTESSGRADITIHAYGQFDGKRETGLWKMHYYELVDRRLVYKKDGPSEWIDDDDTAAADFNARHGKPSRDKGARLSDTKTIEVGLDTLWAARNSPFLKTADGSLSIRISAIDKLGISSIGALSNVFSRERGDNFPEVLNDVRQTFPRSQDVSITVEYDVDENKYGGGELTEEAKIQPVGRQATLDPAEGKKLLSQVLELNVPAWVYVVHSDGASEKWHVAKVANGSAESLVYLYEKGSDVPTDWTAQEPNGLKGYREFLSVDLDRVLDRATRQGAYSSQFLIDDIGRISFLVLAEGKTLAKATDTADSYQTLAAFMKELNTGDYAKAGRDILDAIQKRGGGHVVFESGSKPATIRIDPLAGAAESDYQNVLQRLEAFSGPKNQGSSYISMEWKARGNEADLVIAVVERLSDMLSNVSRLESVTPADSKPKLAIPSTIVFNPIPVGEKLFDVTLVLQQDPAAPIILGKDRSYSLPYLAFVKSDRSAAGFIAFKLVVQVARNGRIRSNVNIENTFSSNDPKASRFTWELINALRSSIRRGQLWTPNELSPLGARLAGRREKGGIAGTDYILSKWATDSVRETLQKHPEIKAVIIADFSGEYTLYPILDTDAGPDRLQLFLRDLYASFEFSFFRYNVSRPLILPEPDFQDLETARVTQLIARSAQEQQKVRAALRKAATKPADEFQQTVLDRIQESHNLGHSSESRKFLRDLLNTDYAAFYRLLSGVLRGNIKTSTAPFYVISALSFLLSSWPSEKLSDFESLVSASFTVPNPRNIYASDLLTLSSTVIKSGLFADRSFVRNLKTYILRTALDEGEKLPLRVQATRALGYVDLPRAPGHLKRLAEDPQKRNTLITAAKTALRNLRAGARLAASKNTSEKLPSSMHIPYKATRVANPLFSPLIWKYFHVIIFAAFFFLNVYKHTDPFVYLTDLFLVFFAKGYGTYQIALRTQLTYPKETVLKLTSYYLNHFEKYVSDEDEIARLKSIRDAYELRKIKPMAYSIAYDDGIRIYFTEQTDEKQIFKTIFYPLALWIVPLEPRRPVKERVINGLKNLADKVNPNPLPAPSGARLAAQTIKSLSAREVLDSRGNPTVYVELTLADGTTGSAMVPSGASTGEREALELRDGDSARFKGKGVLQAIHNIMNVIQPALLKTPTHTQQSLDAFLKELDGTPDKSKLGANAILGVSQAFAPASAKRSGQPLYVDLKNTFNPDGKMSLPVPIFNVLNGGAHANGPLEFQEFMVRMDGAKTFAQANLWGMRVFEALWWLLVDGKYLSSDGQVIRPMQEGERFVPDVMKKGKFDERATIEAIVANLNKMIGPKVLGNEKGFAPKLNNEDQAINLVLAAIKNAGLEGKGVTIALDVASSEFYEQDVKDPAVAVPAGHYRHRGENKTSAQMLALYEVLIAKYPQISSIEDGMAEGDTEGWKALTKALGGKIQLVGDDNFVTNTSILEPAIQQGIANAGLVKLNQIGTVTETVEFIQMLQKAGYGAVISHRSGETEDSFIMDLAVAMDAGQIKAGSPYAFGKRYRGPAELDQPAPGYERYAKNDRGITVERGLGDKAYYSGPRFLAARSARLADRKKTLKFLSETRVEMGLHFRPGQALQGQEALLIPFSQPIVKGRYLLGLETENLDLLRQLRQAQNTQDAVIAFVATSTPNLAISAAKSGADIVLLPNDPSLAHQMRKDHPEVLIFIELSLGEHETSYTAIQQRIGEAETNGADAVLLKSYRARGQDGWKQNITPELLFLIGKANPDLIIGVAGGIVEDHVNEVLALPKNVVAFVSLFGANTPELLEKRVKAYRRAINGARLAALNAEEIARIKRLLRSALLHLDHFFDKVLTKKSLGTGRGREIISSMITYLNDTLPSKLVAASDPSQLAEIVQEFEAKIKTVNDYSKETESLRIDHINKALLDVIAILRTAAGIPNASLISDEDSGMEAAVEVPAVVQLADAVKIAENKMRMLLSSESSIGHALNLIKIKNSLELGKISASLKSARTVLERTKQGTASYKKFEGTTLKRAHSRVKGAYKRLGELEFENKTHVLEFLQQAETELGQLAAAEKKNDLFISAGPRQGARLAAVKSGDFLLNGRGSDSDDTVLFPEDWDLPKNEDAAAMKIAIAEFFLQKVLPNGLAIDDGEVDIKTFIEEAGELGFLGTMVPDSYSDVVHVLKIIKTLIDMYAWYANPSLASPVRVHTGVGTYPIVMFGTEEQKQKYLRPLSSAKKIAAYLLTEPDKGSDALSRETILTTKAELKTDPATGEQYWELNGGKRFITNARYADVLIVIASTGGSEKSVFIVDRDTPGVTVGSDYHKLGLSASSTADVSFDNVRIPAGNLLGKQGEGEKIAMATLNHGRVAVAAGSWGGSQRVFDETLKYLLERKQFNAPLVDWGAVQLSLAEIESDIYAMESIAYAVSALFDGGEENAGLEAAAAKTWTSQRFNVVAREGVELHGGNGFMHEYAVSHYYRDAIITKIFEGSNPVLYSQVVADLALKKLKDIQKNGKGLFEDWEIPSGGPLVESAELIRYAASLVDLAGKEVENRGGSKAIRQDKTKQAALMQFGEMTTVLYAITSTFNRTKHRIEKGLESEHQIQMTQVLVIEEVERIEKLARRILSPGQWHPVPVPTERLNGLKHEIAQTTLKARGWTEPAARSGARLATATTSPRIKEKGKRIKEKTGGIHAAGVRKPEGLAGRDEAGKGALQSNKQIPQGRTIRSDGAASSSVRVDPSQHRRGQGQEPSEGIHSVPLYVSGLGMGIDYFNQTLRRARLLDQRPNGSSYPSLRRNHRYAEWAYSFSPVKDPFILLPLSFPLGDDKVVAIGARLAQSEALAQLRLAADALIQVPAYRTEAGPALLANASLNVFLNSGPESRLLTRKDKADVYRIAESVINDDRAPTPAKIHLGNAVQILALPAPYLPFLPTMEQLEGLAAVLKLPELTPQVASRVTLMLRELVSRRPEMRTDVDAIKFTGPLSDRREIIDNALAGARLAGIATSDKGPATSRSSLVASLDSSGARLSASLAPSKLRTRGGVEDPASLLIGPITTEEDVDGLLALSPKVAGMLRTLGFLDLFGRIAFADDTRRIRVFNLIEEGSDGLLIEVSAPEGVRQFRLRKGDEEAVELGAQEHLDTNNLSFETGLTKTLDELVAANATRPSVSLSDEPKLLVVHLDTLENFSKGVLESLLYHWNHRLSKGTVIVLEGEEHRTDMAMEIVRTRSLKNKRFFTRETLPLNYQNIQLESHLVTDGDLARSLIQKNPGKRWLFLQSTRNRGPGVFAFAPIASLMELVAAGHVQEAFSLFKVMTGYKEGDEEGQINLEKFERMLEGDMNLASRFPLPFIKATFDEIMRLYMMSKIAELSA